MTSELRDQDPPERLLRNLARAPLVEEKDIDRLVFRMRSDLVLSRREIDVLRSLGDGGLNIGETAEVYGITSETVKRTLKTVKAKLGAKTTMQAVARAIRQGLI